MGQFACSRFVFCCHWVHCSIAILIIQLSSEMAVFASARTSFITSNLGHVYNNTTQVHLPSASKIPT